MGLKPRTPWSKQHLDHWAILLYVLVKLTYWCIIHFQLLFPSHVQVLHILVKSAFTDLKTYSPIILILADFNRQILPLIPSSPIGVHWFGLTGEAGPLVIGCRGPHRSAKLADHMTPANRRPTGGELQRNKPIVSLFFPLDPQTYCAPLSLEHKILCTSF